MDKIELEALLTPAAPISEEEKELRAWLKLNRATLLDRYEPFEVLQFALQNGFNDKLAYSVIVNYHDAMAGTMIENRSAMRLFTFMSAVDRVQEMRAKLEYVKELDLRPQWKELFDNQTGGDAA